MAQRKMIDIPIGSTARSHARAPIDGDYQFVEHHQASDCKPSGADATIYIGRGQLMPTCKSCGKRGTWKLTESRFDIPEEQNKTPFALKELRGDRPDVAYPAGTKR